MRRERLATALRKRGPRAKAKAEGNTGLSERRPRPRTLTTRGEEDGQTQTVTLREAPLAPVPDAVRRFIDPGRRGGRLDRGGRAGRNTVDRSRRMDLGTEGSWFRG